MILKLKPRLVAHKALWNLFRVPQFTVTVVVTGMVGIIKGGKPGRLEHKWMRCPQRK